MTRLTTILTFVMILALATAAFACPNCRDTIANTAGSEMGVASALLQHTDPRTTQKHYNKGERISAMQRYQALMDQWERRLD
jgi:hypothetical protein